MTKTIKRGSPIVGFVESMECLPVSKLPEGPEWSYEIKLDGFRLEAIKKRGETTLYSRRGNILNRKFHYIATALKTLPDNTVLDGELVALDSKGKTDFGLLQNFRSAESKIHFYVFDILVLKGKDVSQLPLDARREARAAWQDPAPQRSHQRISGRAWLHL
jgi:ATP-dependent DNA ligase